MERYSFWEFAVSPPISYKQMTPSTRECFLYVLSLLTDDNYSTQYDPKDPQSTLLASFTCSPNISVSFLIPLMQVMGGTPDLKRGWDAVRSSTADQYRNPKPARNQPRGSTDFRTAATLSTTTNTATSSIAQTRRSALQDQIPENTRLDIPSMVSSTEWLSLHRQPIAISHQNILAPRTVSSHPRC